ncbi:DMT family transporter [Rhodobacteraceae bacterium RKSG542]|uniref:DMT family transporter n=1 Tax=Pseudovibrio flavus TaxID=2529854 RepID=UPI0012BD47C8|nr:DMT family transporter [Pseudovibrio flavus]MTI16037.1 DMT family transporter [Pseudovibrio flavus]
MLRDAPVLKGIVLICISFFSMTATDAVTKFAVQSIHPIELTFWRFVAQVVVVFFLFRLWNHVDKLKTSRPVANLARGVCHGITTALFFLAVQSLQLAQATTILFAMPLMVTILAGPILGDWPTRASIVAAAVGFVGVIIITDPFGGSINPAMLYAVAAAVVYTGYTLLTRSLVRTETDQTLLFYSAVAGSLALLPMAYPYIGVGEGKAYWLACVICAGGMTAHWIFQHAYRFASAAVLTPFMYTQLIWTVIIGYLIFSDIPPLTTVLGSVVIIGAGLYNFLYERNAHKKSRGQKESPEVSPGPSAAE